MNISSQITENGQKQVIAIEGNFDFNLQKSFRSTYEDVDRPVSKYEVDLSMVKYLDSSALGMLLLLRDFAGGDRSDITIKCTSDDIKELLEISSFGRLFDIRE